MLTFADGSVLATILWYFLLSHKSTAKTSWNIHKNVIFIGSIFWDMMMARPGMLHRNLFGVAQLNWAREVMEPFVWSASMWYAGSGTTRAQMNTPSLSVLAIMSSIPFCKAPEKRAALASETW